MIRQFSSIKFVWERDQLCERMQTQVSVRTIADDQRAQCRALPFAESFITRKNVVAWVRTGDDISLGQFTRKVPKSLSGLNPVKLLLETKEYLPMSRARKIVIKISV